MKIINYTVIFFTIALLSGCSGGGGEPQIGPGEGSPISGIYQGSFV